MYFKGKIDYLAIYQFPIHPKCIIFCKINLFTIDFFIASLSC